ncbi:polysaccharide lyase family 14 protein [Rhizoctonia solani AG-3 Rhs1AP]|uniref:Polysaccharide lyase family 14 protein n=3 Tax=Eukaryota TaxID=2759 RepID=A0A074S7P5_9AGAM|nr:polysaccharide lyase family 14 protein [Rhizoctonia solani AG-3 Rhs1AP]KEP55426.1 polysaccharide lyase family 14 protein [Rhizoctonia solani 123E]
MYSHAIAFLLSVSGLQVVTAQASQTYAATLAALHGLPTSTVLPFPTATIPAPNSQAFITAGASSDNLGWSLAKGRIQNGGDNMAFVADPFPSASLTKDPDVSASAYADPVLQVTYPAGSYSNHTGGGAQFIQLWNTTTNLQSMVLSYEVAFDANFDFVKGGKLPGLRGGPDVLGCSGGKQANGRDCFSTRLMWRTNGNGEVYAYIRPVNGICDSSLVRCNDDFGISVNRGSFAFQSGTWNRITMLVRLNSPNNVANGQLQLFYNDLLALSYTGIQYRNSDNINSISGLFFSTFFGGEDSSWASPKEQHTYFRNIRMWGSDAPSNMTGNRVNAASPVAVASPVWLSAVVAIASAFAGAIFAL